MHFSCFSRKAYSKVDFGQQKYSVIIVVPMHFSCFSRKAYSKVHFGHVKILDAIFSGQSLVTKIVPVIHMIIL